MQPSKRGLWLLYVMAGLGMILWAGGCGKVPTPVLSTATPTRQLTLYRSPTPSQTLVPRTPLKSSTVTPRPTSTPFTHVIAKNDTMLGIALKYGVSLEDLLAANPGVDPNILTVGKTIIIPIKVEDPAAIPTLTPIPVSWDPPYCYQIANGGAWCFLVVKNDRQRGLENLSAWIGLFAPGGENIAGQTAVPPLNLLLPGNSLPLAAYFQPTLPVEFITQAEMLTAVRVPQEDKRYLDAEVQVSEVDISPDGGQASVTGSVILPPQSPPASQVWVAVIAYGEDGRVVGFRKWESDPACLGPTASATIEATRKPRASPIPPRDCMSFAISVFSLGPAIQKVDVQVEARP